MGVREIDQIVQKQKWPCADILHSAGYRVRSIGYWEQLFTIPVVNKNLPQKKSVKDWFEVASERLIGLFDTTAWEALCSPHGEDINSLTDCITDYIHFCVENTVPSRKVQCFPNNNPWVNSGIKTLGDEKKRVFRSGDKEELRRV